MPLRRQLAVLLALSIMVTTAPVVNATLPPEIRQELSDLQKELRSVNSLVKKKEVDQAKEIIRKADDRIKELAIAEDEKDRAYSTFKLLLERARNLIPVSFKIDVAPILKSNCLRCHGETQASANLRLDTFNWIVKGGRSGVPIAPRSAARSGIMLRIASPNDEQRMPRGSARLIDADIMTMARWIDQGANFDGTNRDAPIGESSSDSAESAKPVTVVMADGSESVSFKNDIAPWLVNICIVCHSGNNPRGKFGFTTFEQLLRGGPTGSTIVPGKPDESYIVDLVLRQEPLRMPQGQAQLKRSQAIALETWIREGAHFDGDDPKAPLRSIVPTEAQLQAERLANMTDEDFAERRIAETAAIWKRVSPKTAGVSATSANFNFYGTTTESRLQQLSEMAEEHLAELGKRYPLPDDQQAFRGRLTVFVTKERFDYEEFNTVLLNRRTPKSVSGHSVITPEFETAYVAMHDTGDTESADSLTAQQLMKSLLSQSYLTRDGSNLPDWLKQGFGIQESGLKPDSLYAKSIPNRVANAVSTITDSSKLFDDGTLAPEEVADVGYLLIRFLEGQGGPARFQQFVSELRKNSNAASAVKRVYNTSAAQMGQSFLRTGG
jgi:hypothetical protein